MKRMIYLLFAIVTCVIFMTGCSFFSKPGNTTTDEFQVPSDADKDTTDAGTTEEEGEEIQVGNPEDLSSEEDITTTEDTTEDTGKDTSPNDKESSNPRENIADDASKEYTGTGKYCGFIDSISVEIELSDGSYCSFFVFDAEVKSTLSALNEEDTPEITFTYKGKDGQVNPEMISVIGG